MKNKILLFSSLLAGCGLFFVACDKSEDPDSVVRTTSIPYIAIPYLESAYVYGQGQSTLFSDIPDVVAVAVDSVVGFEGGYGGKTGMDSIKILKSDITGFGDTSSIGGSGITFQKFNKAGYKATITANIVIAGPIPNPGPTALEGSYLRAANGIVIDLVKVFDGVYVVDNPGGAGVPAFPYLLYNYESSNGTDSLSFPIQTNPCGGGLQLVGSGAPSGLTSADYTEQNPPEITSLSPITLVWRIYEFPAASASSAHTGAALCQFGLGIRTFTKQ